MEGNTCTGQISESETQTFALFGLKSSFSLNCMDWHLLQDPSEETMTKTDVIRGRFIGDPSYEVCLRVFHQLNRFQYEHVDVQRIGEGDDAHDEETVFTIKVSFSSRNKSFTHN